MPRTACGCVLMPPASPVPPFLQWAPPFVLFQNRRRLPAWLQSRCIRGGVAGAVVPLAAPASADRCLACGQWRLGRDEPVRGRAGARMISLAAAAVVLCGGEEGGKGGAAAGVVASGDAEVLATPRRPHRGEQIVHAQAQDTPGPPALWAVWGTLLLTKRHVRRCALAGAAPFWGGLVVGLRVRTAGARCWPSSVVLHTLDPPLGVVRVDPAPR